MDMDISSAASDAPVRFQLDNGLKVILKEQHGSPVVALQAWVGVGSADEPEEIAGVAHVFEHMLFKGTARRGVGAIAREVESAGGDINAWTSFDQTVYHLVLASRFADTGLDILTDALRNSSFDETELSRELRVVLEEVKQGEDSPSRVVTQALFSAAYGEHNYRRPVIGYTRTVEKFTRKTLVDFFRAWYVPNNITLVMAGDFDAARAKKRITTAWKGARARALPDTKQNRVEPPQKKTRVALTGAEVSEVHLVLGFHIPGMQHVDTGALDLGAIILGQGDSSRLQTGVRRGRQLVTDAYAYSFTPRDPGLLVVGATLPIHNTEEALAALAGEAFRMAREPASVEELAKAKAIVESDAVYQKETVQGMARKLGFFETVAGSLDYEEEYLRQARATTPGQLAEAMARWARPENCTISALLPSETEALKNATTRRQLAARLTAIVAEAAKPSRPVQVRKRAAAAGKSAGAAPAGEVIREVLPSGLRVLVMRDASVPLVAMRAAWLGGLRDETPRTNGISNLLAALITRGTERRSGDQIAREIESLAGGIGGFSGRNSFGVRAEVMARHFEHGLDVLADCVLHGAWPEEELAKERRQVLEEIRTQEDNVSSVAFRLFANALYKTHPYRMDLLGSAESVRALDRERLVEYYKSRFSPAGMSIAIVGDVDPAAAISQVQRLFAEAQLPAYRPSPPPLDPAPDAPLRVLRHLNKQQAHLVVGFRGTTIADQDRFALEVLSTILSGQGGRLFDELREKNGLAYRVSAFTLEGIDPGYVAVYVACGPENLGTVEERIFRELRRVTDRRVTNEELSRARRYLAGSHDISLQRRSALAASLAFNECYGLGWDQYRRYAASILAVTADDVQRVAQKFLDPSRVVIACVRPEEAAPAVRAS